MVGAIGKQTEVSSRTAEIVRIAKMHTDDGDALREMNKFKVTDLQKGK